jgi:hypothetical protein
LQVFSERQGWICEIEHHCFYLEFGNISGRINHLWRLVWQASKSKKYGREKKPKKDSQWFSGMKRTTSGRYKKIWPFSQSMKVKPGMSDYQTMFNSCRCEKAKLRAVEKRTVTRRVGNRWNKGTCHHASFAYQTAKARKECDQH